MARKQPTISAEERERNRRLAEDAARKRCAAAAKAKTGEAQAWLQARGLLVPGEGVRDRLVRLYRYRSALQESVQKAYRPTMRQQQSRQVGTVEIEF